MSQYLVSICIPTYNRAPYLKKCLDSLVCQPEFQEGLVEIVVSDNASTDSTYDLVKKYQIKYKNIIYHKNAKNIGFQNIGLVATLANGTFCKLGNDTLIYKPESLKYFCEIVGKYKADRPILWFSNGNVRTKVKEETCFSFPEEFLYAASFYITWLGTIGVWKEDVEAYAKCFFKKQNELGQTENLINLLQQHRPIVLLTKVFSDGSHVKGKNVSYGIFRVFYHEYLGLIQRLRTSNLISSKCLNELEKDLFFCFFTNSIILWETNFGSFRYSDENLKDLVFKECAKKKYFKKFRRHYRTEKVKWLIKRMPIGIWLIRIKHIMK